MSSNRVFSISVPPFGDLFRTSLAFRRYIRSGRPFLQDNSLITVPDAHCPWLSYYRQDTTSQFNDKKAVPNDTAGLDYSQFLMCFWSCLLTFIFREEYVLCLAMPSSAITLRSLRLVRIAMTMTRSSSLRVAM